MDNMGATVDRVVQYALRHHDRVVLYALRQLDRVPLYAHRQFWVLETCMIVLTVR